MFTISVFTTPSVSYFDESNIKKILQSDTVDFLHLRKPNASLQKIQSILDRISPEKRRKIILHDHFSLVKDYNIGGVQLNSRNPKPPVEAKILTKSCHSIEEIKELKKYKYSYVTLSPIFPSISKPGYSVNMSFETLKKQLLSSDLQEYNIIALGGVTPKKIPVLKELGFSGAAFLGALYMSSGELMEDLLDTINKFKLNI